MSILGRVVAVLLGVAIAVTLPFTLLALAWGRVLFSPEQMTDILAGELVNSGALQQFAIEAMLSREDTLADESPGGGPLDFLGRQRLDELLASLFPPDWARSQINGIVEDLYAWIDNDRLKPELGIDIEPVTDRLQAGGAEELAREVVSSWPACGQEQIQLLEIDALVRGELPPFFCQPPEPLRSRVIATATDFILGQTRNLPSFVSLGQGDGAEAPPESIMQSKRSLRFLRGFAEVGWMLPASLLGLIVAVTVRSWPGLLRWWGGPILGAGLGTFTTLGTSKAIAEQARNSQPFHSTVGAFLEPVVQDVIDRLLDAVGGRMFVLAFAITALGLAMLLAGIFLDRTLRRAHPSTGSG